MKPVVWWVSLLAALMLAIDTGARTEPDLLVGKHLYRSYCLACHGVDGKSKGPLAEKLNVVPADLSSDEYQMRDVEDLAAIIGAYGRKDDASTPCWGEVLPETDRRNIAAYIPELTREGLRFRGDARSGRVIFKSGCVACHGQFGTGKGVLARLIDLSMVDYTKSEAMKEISDEEIIEIIREGKGDFMPSWQEALDDDEITDVAAYVRRLSELTVITDSKVQYKPNPLVGHHLYRSYCLVCHELEGKSKGPLAEELDLEPADLSSDEYRKRNVADLAAVIGGYKRKEDSNMPSWGEVLPETDLHDIAAYVRKLTLNELRFRGDARRGRVIFKSACAACHGQFGTGAGVLAEMIRIISPDFTRLEDMEEISDRELIEIIREGKGDYMASWKETLNENEIADVAAYVRRLAE